MNVNELGFRQMYHRVCFIRSNTKIINVMKNSDFPGKEKANGVLVYGYIDYEAGFTFEVLGWAFCNDNNIVSYDGNETVTIKLRRGSVADSTIILLDKYDDVRYQSKIDRINEGYSCSDNVAVTREIELIDQCRNGDFPDDVLVYLISENNEPEGCWVRCLGINDNHIQGRLLNEPNQDFGFHCGETIEFGIMKQEEAYICVAAL